MLAEFVPYCPSGLWRCPSLWGISRDFWWPSWHFCWWWITKMLNELGVTRPHPSTFLQKKILTKNIWQFGSMSPPPPPPFFKPNWHPWIQLADISLCHVIATKIYFPTSLEWLSSSRNALQPQVFCCRPLSGMASRRCSRSTCSDWAESLRFLGYHRSRCLGCLACWAPVVCICLIDVKERCERKKVNNYSILYNHLYSTLVFV